MVATTTIDQFRGPAKPLNAASAFITEAGVLRCKVSIIHAFSNIESAGSGFIAGSGLPAALFEAKAFSDRTEHKYDKSAPNISSRTWNRALYGSGGLHQWDRFAQAYALDQEAAMQSMSLGRFQAMGFNYKMLGYTSVRDMYSAFSDDEQNHLIGFGNFITSAGLLSALRANPPKFVALAIGYNGAGEKQNGYDQKLETEFYHCEQAGENYIPSPSGIPSNTDQPTAEPPQPKPAPFSRLLVIGSVGPDVSSAQTLLNRWGFSCDVTSRFDAATFSAVENFQVANHLTKDGKIGPLTAKALGMAT